MTQPGEQRPSGALPPPPPIRRQPNAIERLRPHSAAAAFGEAVLVVIVAALAWGVLKGILEIGIGLVPIALLGGWLIGTILRSVSHALPLAMTMAALAWLGGLLCTWLLAMAILPGSSRSFLERLEGTPFLDWLSPQFGIIEVVALLAYLGAAAYGARAPR
jgi:hypothetical protein